MSWVLEDKQEENFERQFCVYCPSILLRERVNKTGDAATQEGRFDTNKTKQTNLGLLPCMRSNVNL